MTPPVRQHGGARKGAGRKPEGNVERRVRLPRDVIQALTEFGHGRLRYGIVYLAACTCPFRGARTAKSRLPTGPGDSP